MKKIGNILFLYFFVFVMCMGASFAWYAWKGTEVSVDVNFADLDPYIKYTPLTIKESDKNKTLTESDDYTGGIGYDLTFNKNANGDNLDAYGQNYLKVTSVTNSNLFKASNLKWTLVSVSDGNRTIISTGNFVGESVVEGNDTSKMIPISIDFSLTKESDNTNYEFYLWLDSKSHQNVNISNENITVSMASSASTNDNVDETYIRSIEYEAGVIKKFTAYSSEYDITGYKITNTETTPSSDDSDWITISSDNSTTEAATIETGKIVTIEPNKTMDTINNICIKNSNNEVYCKSIGKYIDEAGDKSIENATITLDPTSYTYDGNAKKPTVTVVLNNKTLVLNTDYSVSYSNNINVGIATVTVTGKGNYTGTKSVNFTINGITYTATFNNGSGVSAIGSSKLTCTTTTENNTSCSVTAPTITSSTGYGTGKWGTSSSTQGSISAGSSITLSSNATYYAIALPNTYTVTLNSGNLVIGLEDISSATTDRMSYSVSNKVVTVTANYDDGYGFINGRVYLEANTEYIFSCDTDGTWGEGVEAFLMLNGQYNTYYYMSSNSNYSFTPTKSGIYYIRLDVNESGKTYKFYNINISKNISTKSVTYNSTYGELAEPTREGYTFNGWYKGSTKVTSSTKYNIADNSTLTANWTANKIKLTLDVNGGSGGTTTIWYYFGTSTFYSNENCTTTITSISIPTKTRYTFMEYYGDGTSGGNNLEQYISSTGTFGKNLAIEIYKDATLYARWEDITPPTLTLSHSNGVITITSDTSNIYSGTSPSAITRDPNTWNSITAETTITDVSSSSPGPVSDSTTWKLDTSDSDNPQWIGWQGNYGNIFSGSANDIIIVSGYYKTSAKAGISKIVDNLLYKSDWSGSYSTSSIDSQGTLVDDGNWHYFYSTFRVNESYLNAIISSGPAWGYTKQKGTLYINGLNWRIVPSSNTTASDIHIRKWASGSQSLSYFQNGGGTQISGNSFKVSSSGTYTVYVEDAAGNGTIKTIDVNSYTLSITKGTGVGTIYYKVNGASSYSSTSSNASLSVISGATYYYYGTPSSGYYMTTCTESSPCSGTMGTSNVSKSLEAYEAVYQLYNSSGTSTGYANSLTNAISSVSSGGTVKALKSNSSSAITLSKDVTIDTNGYTITMTSSTTYGSSESTFAIFIPTGYTLSITGSGKIYSSISLSGGLIANYANSGNYGTLNLSDATLQCTSCVAVIDQDGIFNMDSGSILGSTTGIRNFYGTATIKGGTINGASASGIGMYGGNLHLVTGLYGDPISISGMYYGIISGGWKTANVNITISSPRYASIKIFTTATASDTSGGKPGSSVALSAEAHDSNNSYTVTTEIYGGASFYSYGHGIANGEYNTMKIEGSEGVYGVIVESRNITIWNKGTLKLGYNPESITLDTAISKPYVTIANANYNYAIANYGTIYMGGGTYVYDTRDTSSYTSDNTKKPIANCGTFNLYGGRTYYNFGVDSAFNNEVETAIVNIYQDEDSWWDVNRNGSTYTFNYYNAETSYTLNKYSYRKGKSKS